MAGGGWYGMQNRREPVWQQLLSKCPGRHLQQDYCHILGHNIEQGRNDGIMGERVLRQDCEFSSWPLALFHWFKWCKSCGRRGPREPTPDSAVRSDVAPVFCSKFAGPASFVGMRKLCLPCCVKLSQFLATPSADSPIDWPSYASWPRRIGEGHMSVIGSKHSTEDHNNQCWRTILLWVWHRLSR